MTGRVVNNLIEVRQGDSFVINFEFIKDCKPIDLTGAQMLMEVKDDDGKTIFSLSGTAVDVVNGKMALVLTPEQTSKPAGDYSTDIQITFADGSVNTIFPANVNQVAVFRITEQVTGK